MKRVYKRKTEEWAESLVDGLIAGVIDWEQFFSFLKEFFWRLQHNHTNKQLFVQALARRMVGVKIVQ